MARKKARLPLAGIRNRFSGRQLAILLLLVISFGGYIISRSFAGTQSAAKEIRLVQLINEHRGSHGINQLTRSKCLTLAAREHAAVMGNDNKPKPYHSDYKALMNKYGCGNFRNAGENVGEGHTSVDGAHNGYLNSPCHHANMDSRKFVYNEATGECSVTGGYNSSLYNFVGVAAYQKTDGTLATVEIFGYCRGCGGEWTAPVPDSGWVQGVKHGSGAEGAVIEYVCCSGSQGTRTDNPYFFNNLPNGLHRIRAHAPSGMRVIGHSKCFNETGCHGAPQAYGTDAVFEVPSQGYVDLHWYFEPVGTILGRVWIDANGNGGRDNGESYVKTANCSEGTQVNGVHINISGVGNYNLDLCNPEPYYSADVVGGSRTVKVVPPSGWVATTAAQTVNVTRGSSSHLWFGIKPADTLPQSDGTGIFGSYFNNQDFTAPVFKRTDPYVNFDFGSSSPNTSSMPADTFSIRWTGKLKAPYTGNYRFYTVSDDGVRLYVNNQLVVNNWSDHAPTENASGEISLTAGQRYDIKLEYYENGGGATIKLLWSGPNFAKRVIPQGYLYPVDPGSANTPPPASSCSVVSKLICI